MSEANPTGPADSGPAADPSVAANAWRQFLFEAHPLPMWVYDMETLAFLAVNDAAVAHYGYSREEFLRMKTTEIRPPEEVPRLLEFLSRPLLTVNRSGDWRHRKKDGTIIHVEVTSHPLEFHGRHARLALANDVTGRRASERAERERAAHLNTALEASKAGTWTWDIASQIPTWDERYHEQYGFAPDETPSLELWLSRLHPEDRDRVYSDTVSLTEPGSAVIWDQQFRIVHPVTGVRWMAGLGRIERDAEGRAVRFAGINLDITERRRTEETMRSQLAEIEAIYRTAPVGLCLLDADFRYVRINEQLAKLNGVPARDHIGRTVREVVPHLADQTEALCRQVRTTGKPVLNMELTGETAAQPGVPRSWIANWWPYTDMDGRFTGVSVTVEETTERKRMEAALRESDSRFRTMAEAMPQIVWMLSLADSQLYVNQQWLQYTGLTVEASQGDGWAKVAHADDFEPMKALMAKTIATGQRSEIQFRLKRAADGQYRWHSATFVPVKDSSGRVQQVLGTSADIDDQKQAEQNLHKSEEHYRLLAESIPVPAWQADAEGTMVYANRRWAQYCGVTALGGKWAQSIHPDDLSQTLEQIKKALANGDLYEIEYRLRRYDGQHRWHISRAYPAKDAAGKVTGWFGTTTDIHDRKTALEMLERLVAERTESLREAADRLRQTIEAGGVGLWDWDLRTNEVYFSPEWKRQIGYEDREIAGKFEEWRSRVHPDDLKPTLARVRFVIRNPTKRYEAEFRFRHKDGSYRWIRAAATPVCDEKGKAVRLRGSHVDVTPRKQAEQALHESEERYRSLVELAPLGIAVIVDKKYGYANPECARIHGVREPSALLGAELLAFTHPDDRGGVSDRWQQVFKERATVPLRERRIVRPNGEVRIVFASSVPISFQGQPAALTVFRDVTELRRLERALVEVSNREQARIGQDLHDSVCQQLVGVAFACQGLQNSLARQAPKLAASAAEICTYVEKALRETRALAQGLAPTELRHNDLAASLGQFAKTTAQLFPVKCVVEADPVLPLTNQEQTFHLYRIAQEAVGNAVRHGKAKNIRVGLHHAPDRLELTVRDNGVGISKAAQGGQSPGMGLPIMRYRAEMMGANLTVNRAGRGRGTIVTCSLPISISTKKPAKAKKRSK